MKGDMSSEEFNRRKLSKGNKGQRQWATMHAAGKQDVVRNRRDPIGYRSRSLAFRLHPMVRTLEIEHKDYDANLIGGDELAQAAALIQQAIAKLEERGKADV